MLYNRLLSIFISATLLLFVGCSGSNSSGSTTQLVGSEVETISGIVTIDSSESESSSHLLSLSSAPHIQLTAGVEDQVAVVGVTVFAQLAKNGQVCGQATTGANGQYTITIPSGECLTQFNDDQTFRVDARTASQGSGSTVSTLVTGYFSLAATNPLQVNLNQRTTLQASVIDHRMTQVGLTQENLAKATSASDSEFAAIESIYQSALQILTPDFFGEDSSAKCDYSYTSSTEVTADEVMDLHLLVCADTYLRNLAGATRSGRINGIFDSAGSVAATFYTSQIQTDSNGDVLDSGFEGNLKFGLTVTQNLGTTLSTYHVTVPNGVNAIRNIELGQRVSFSNFDSTTVWQTTTFTAVDVGDIPGTLVNPTFKYAVGESALSSDRVAGSVYTTSLDYSLLSGLCQGSGTTCYEYTGDTSSSVALVVGCTNSSACNYSPLANRDDGSCATACDSCNSDGSVNRNVFCQACDADEFVLNGQCSTCAPGTTNAAGDITTNGNTFCDVTVCLQDYYVSSNDCVSCTLGTTNLAGDLANGADTTCDAVTCLVGQYVLDHVCTYCPSGKTNTAGDDAAGPNTSCSCASPNILFDGGTKKIIGTDFFHSSQQTPSGQFGEWITTTQYVVWMAEWGNLWWIGEFDSDGTFVANVISGSSSSNVPTSAEVTLRLQTPGSVAVDSLWTGTRPHVDCL